MGLREHLLLSTEYAASLGPKSTVFRSTVSNVYGSELRSTGSARVRFTFSRSQPLWITRKRSLSGLDSRKAPVQPIPQRVDWRGCLGVTEGSRWSHRNEFRGNPSPLIACSASVPPPAQVGTGDSGDNSARNQIPDGRRHSLFHYSFRMSGTGGIHGIYAQPLPSAGC
jgi:hypothetical protein